MTPLRLRDLAADGAVLLRRFGLMVYLDFLAVSIGSTTLNILLAPERFRAAAAGGTGGGVLSVLADPFVLGHEVVFALVFGAACLRIWSATEGTEAALPRNQLVPLVALNILAGYAAYLGILMMLLPGLVISALTTTLVPAVVLERRGWNALARSIAMTRDNIWPLTVAWTAIILPWLVLTISATPDAALAGADTGTLWLAWLVPDFFAAGLGTVSLCLVMAAYGRLITGESGGGGRQLHDIFR